MTTTKRISGPRRERSSTATTCQNEAWATYSPGLECDDALLLLARSDDSTLTGIEGAQLAHHLQECESCREVAAEGPSQVSFVSNSAVYSPHNADTLDLPQVQREMFSVEGTIGRGGMGRVVRARDRRLNRTVAIKEVLDASLRPRLEREARITARLQHPAIVPVYEAGTFADGEVFYSMPLLQGRTLAERIKACKDSASRLELLASVTAVVEAIAYAHSQAVIHRDLKPSNVLIGEYGETIVIDWGLAKELDSAEMDEDASLLAGASDLTRVGSVIGTPGFMAPEQARGEAVGRPADVYALGAILYTLLVGHPPFTREATDADDVLRRVQRESPKAIARLAPDAPADLIAIAERAMAPVAADRYPDASGMAAELHRFQAGLLIQSRHYSRRELLGRWLARHRAMVMVIGLASVVLAIGATIATRNVLSSRDQEEQARLRAEGALDLAQKGRDELIFQQARAAIQSDPTATLAWLKQYPEDAARSRAAGLLAAEARRRGISWRVLESSSPSTTELAFVGNDQLEVGLPLQRWSLASTVAVALPADAIAVDAAGQCRASLDAIVCTDAKGSQQRWDAPAKIASAQFANTANQRLAVVTLDKGGLVFLDLETWQDRRVLTELWMRPTVVRSDEYLLASLARRAWLIPLASGSPIAVQWPSMPGLQPSADDPDEQARAYALAIATTKGTTKMAAALMRGSSQALVSSSSAEGPWMPLQTGWDEELLVSAMAFSDDLQRLAVASDTGALVVFELSSGQRLRSIDPIGSYVFALALDQSGDQIFAATESHGVWGANTMDTDPPQPVPGVRGAVWNLALSADSSLVATTSSDGRVRVERINDHVELIEEALAKLSTPGNCNATIGSERHGEWRWFYCVNHEDGTPLRHLRVADTGQVDEVIVPWPIDAIESFISEDGSTIFSPGPTTSTIWRDGKLRELAIPADDESQLSADGRYLWTSHHGIQKWDLQTGAVVSTIDAEVATAIASPDDKLLLVERASGLAILDAEGTTLSSQAVHWEHGPLRWSANSTAVVAPVGEAGLMHYSHVDGRWRRLTGQQTEGWKHFSGLSISPDGTVVGAQVGSEMLVWLPLDDVVWRFTRDDMMSGQVTNEGIELETSEQRFFAPFPAFKHDELNALSNAVIDDNGRLTNQSADAGPAEGRAPSL